MVRRWLDLSSKINNKMRVGIGMKEDRSLGILDSGEELKCIEKGVNNCIEVHGQSQSI